MKSAPSMICLGGPTAAGKSAAALALAERLGGEIVSVDSIQVYRGLDVGAAKPPPEARARVPHHLIDVADLREVFDAARFVKLAKETIADIRSRGRLPILCGGTGFYFKALLVGLDKLPPADPRLRAELAQAPLEALLEELRKADPETWRAIDRANPRRVRRAVEILRLTGRPPSELRTKWGQGKAPPPDAPILVLARPRGALRRRIEERSQRMFASGLIKETRELLGLGLAENPTASRALGYRQAIEFLEGRRSLEETVRLVQIRTWQFARRQLAWFKRQLPAKWVPLSAEASAEEAAQRLLHELDCSGS